MGGEGKREGKEGWMDGGVRGWEWSKWSCVELN